MEFTNFHPISHLSLELRPPNSYFLPSRFRKAWPASTKAGVAPVSKSREKMPRNQMCCGKCLDDIKDLSWVTERHVSWRNAKELGRSVRYVRCIFAQKPSFHWRFSFFGLIVLQSGFYITYLIDLTHWTKSSSGPTKKQGTPVPPVSFFGGVPWGFPAWQAENPLSFNRNTSLHSCCISSYFSWWLQPIHTTISQKMDDFLHHRVRCFFINICPPGDWVEGRASDPAINGYKWRP